MSTAAVSTPGAAGADPGVRCALDALYNWNYSPEVEELRALYDKALAGQWIAGRDIDWERSIDRQGLSETFSIGGLPFNRTEWWRTLEPGRRATVAAKTTAFLLSNFLHGEQGALMVAAQLVSAVPHMDGKFYAATQTLDEARHVEVFARYIQKLDEVHPVAPALKGLLDAVLATDDWMQKAVGMQVVTEGIALYSFRDMRRQTHEPLLRDLLVRVSQDEARHTGFGIQYLTRVVPELGPREVAAVEDFAFEAARTLIDVRQGGGMRSAVFALWESIGLDPADVMGAIVREQDTILREVREGRAGLGPVRSFVIPTLRRIGLFSERIGGHFQDLFSSVSHVSFGSLKDDPYRLPDDLQAWVLE
jgi:hypothetical protein